MTGEPTQGIVVRPPDAVRPIRDDSMVLAARMAAAQFEAELRLRIDTAREVGRVEIVVRQQILHNADTSSWAANARYHKPVGRKKDPKTGQSVPEYAEGWSIRAIESMIQIWGHVHTVVRDVYEDGLRTKINVAVMDLLTNSSYSIDQTVEKTVERRDSRGRQIRSQRQNMFGDTVFIVEATEEEFRNKLGAERSKMIRDQAQRLLPRDLLDEALTHVLNTLASGDAQDPDKKKKEVLDGFSALGISAQMLREYLEIPLDAISPKDLADLRALWVALKEGQTSWVEVMAAKRESAEDEGAPPPATEPPKQSKVREARDRIVNKTKSEPAKPPEPENKDDKW